MNVLDSSALLTWFKDEPGAETVEACLPGGLLTSLAIGETVEIDRVWLEKTGEGKVGFLPTASGSRCS